MSIDLHRYSAEIAGLEQAWRRSLSTAGIARLRAMLRGDSARDWYRWRDHHARLVHEFVARTPERAAKEPKFREDWERLHFAAIQMCIEARSFLTPVITSCVGEVGGSYRDMVATASTAYCQAVAADVPDWPFGGESPFEGEP